MVKIFWGGGGSGVCGAPAPDKQELRASGLSARVGGLVRHDSSVTAGCTNLERGVESRAASVAVAGNGALERAFVVHGTPGWDEATPVGPFELFDVRPGSVSHTQRDPAVFGVPRCAPEDLAGGDAAANASRLRSALQGEDGPHRDAITIGSALALEVSGRVPGFERGLEAARGAIDDGSGAAFLERLIAFSAGGEDSND